MDFAPTCLKCWPIEVTGWARGREARGARAQPRSFSYLIEDISQSVESTAQIRSLQQLAKTEMALATLARCLDVPFNNAS